MICSSRRSLTTPTSVGFCSTSSGGLPPPCRCRTGLSRARDKGTPQGSPITPPTQWAMFGRWSPSRVGAVGAVGVVAVAVDAFADRDGVADGDLFRADEDVFDEQAQDASAFGDGRGRPCRAAGEEAFEVGGEGEVGFPVGELAVEAPGSGGAGWSRGRAGRACGPGARRG